MAFSSTTSSSLLLKTIIYNNSHSGPHPTEYYTLVDGSTFLHKSFIWIIFACGFPGNLTSLCVIIHMSHRTRLRVPLFFVAVFSIVDNIVIVLKILKQQALYRNIPSSESGCHVMNFLGLTLAAYANWILVVMSAERFTAVVFPLKVKLLWTLRTAVTTLGSLLLLLLLAHVHLFFSMTHQDNVCVFHRAYRTFYPWWLAISSLIYAIVPAFCMIIFTVFIIRALRRSATERNSLVSEAESGSLDLRQHERQVTIMLVVVVVVFILLTLPHCLVSIGYTHWKTVDEVDKQRKYFIKTLTKAIADSNHAVNFYLYCLSGRRFRKYFFDLLQNR